MASASSKVASSSQPLRDPNSVANIQSFTTTNVAIEWIVDFGQSQLSGSVTLTMRRVSKESIVQLDCSAINVLSVTDGATGAALDFFVNPTASKFGGLLAITLMDTTSESFSIRIAYETSGKCSALQWLTPEQTAGKKFPYLFSQCQAIHARTLLPCQDTPAVKAPYSARVTVPAPLVAVMSANKRTVVPPPSGEAPTQATFAFEQTTPIPSYLIALGVGALESRPIGPRSLVWSESEVIEAAAYEFSETEAFLAVAEELVGPYVWERYDILLLPPSFPYGGMENPCLTFLTPSLLTGDRSLVDVVAHEIAHSWTGNLVSCMNWEHFWLNEGFTMFLERKILARIHGEGWRQFNSIIGLADLRESVAQFNGDGPETALMPNLAETDPDDVFSSVPYEKGYTLLYTLEELVGGGAVFEPFFRAHIQSHAGLSIASEDFKQFTLAYFAAQDSALGAKVAAFDWDAWLNGRGMPPTVPSYGVEMLTPCHELASAWLQLSAQVMQSSSSWVTIDDGERSAPLKQSTDSLSDVSLAAVDAISYEAFTPAQKTMFLDVLLQKATHLPISLIKGLNSKYGLSSSTNVEILLKWYLLVIRSGYQAGYGDAAAFATKHGRMKYCRVIYRELAKRGGEGLAMAVDTFRKHQSFYHPIAAQMITKDLHL